MCEPRDLDLGLPRPRSDRGNRAANDLILDDACVVLLAIVAARHCHQTRRSEERYPRASL
jgi:hypothetical protein